MQDLAHLVADLRAAAENLLARIAELERRLPAPPPVPVPEPSPEADDLKRIYGIGPVLERRLHALGIVRFEQMGRWTDADIDAFQAQLPEYPGRIRRGAWVKCARDEYRKKYRRPLA